MQPLPKGPILPPWATDGDVQKKVDELMFDINVHRRYINYRVRNEAPSLIAETESFLQHNAEGW